MDLLVDASNAVVVPRSGFPAALPAGWLLLRRAREVQRATTRIGS